MNLEQLLNGKPVEKLILRINNLPYIISEEEPQKGDVIFDIRDCTCGVHDGVFGNIITFKCDGGNTGLNAVIEGVQKQYVKKLVIMTV